MPFDENNVEFYFWTFFSFVHFIFLLPTYFVDRFAPEIVSNRGTKIIVSWFCSENDKFWWKYLNLSSFNLSGRRDFKTCSEHILLFQEVVKPDFWLLVFGLIS